MIKNNRQLTNSQRKLDGLIASMDELEDLGDKGAYADLIRVVRAEIDEYEAIQAGQIRAFTVSSLDDVGSRAIQARLANKMTQKELASELGVSEQMVQKDESREYEGAGIAKLAEVLDVLGYELVGSIRSKQPRVIAAQYDGESGSNIRAALSATPGTAPTSVSIFIMGSPGKDFIIRSGVTSEDLVK
jgi:transcriptional regulator with XRE-family HTH domain